MTNLGRLLMTTFDGYSTALHAAQLQCTAAAAFSRVFFLPSGELASRKPVWVYVGILIFYDYIHIKKTYTLIVINAV